MTKDLLINFLLTIFPIFLIQMFYLIKYIYQIEKLKGWILAVFPVLSLVLSMLFPLEINRQFVLDLRLIPFIIGGLYGGYRLGLFLLVLVLSIRYFWGSEGAFYLTLIIYPLIGFIIFFLSKYYLKMTIKQKVLVNLSITLFTLIASIPILEIIGVDVEIGLWVRYIVIYVIGILIATILWEGIQTNFQVLQKLMKAEKLQMVSHLAASISHEVRNPLTASRGFIQMLSEDVSAQTRKNYAEIALKELDRATEVINDYLTFAKPTPDKEEKIKVSTEIQHVINLTSPLANMNGVKVSLSLTEDETSFVRGDRKKFQQCLINIIKNGIESIQNCGELQIRYSCTQSTIQIDIQDQGIGMTQEQINRLGEPYFTTKDKGTGLGLMVSYSIIRGMNGTIHVESEKGKGTCFSIKLPIAPNEGEFLKSNLLVQHQQS
ncbi:ATP-binding protein [Peribacillus sp. Hz7]|uniref:ATP-binding protein n=1 Tax=Peribacillus sp. Hz7 TaxID=3344873 RepID=UPI0035C9B04A